eukprot:GHUV01046104.1.p1 GENE.GHUV01046104.1~~GHUV01046104.1.p1  ORF type:complete len:169 (-),score=26.78 GHUV01046104.1:294-800(-)
MSAGTYAEYVVAPESTLLPIPERTSFHEAASVPLAAMTAWQAVESSMPLSGKRVLVHAGAGGVGSFAIQVWAHGIAFLVLNCGCFVLSKGLCATEQGLCGICVLSKRLHISRFVVGMSCCYNPQRFLVLVLKHVAQQHMQYSLLRCSLGMNATRARCGSLSLQRSVVC